jgi:hypothetical protein
MKRPTPKQTPRERLVTLKRLLKSNNQEISLGVQEVDAAHMVNSSNQWSAYRSTSAGHIERPW